jgi:hypothetical protein
MPRVEKFAVGKYRRRYAYYLHWQNGRSVMWANRFHTSSLRASKRAPCHAASKWLRQRKEGTIGRSSAPLCSGLKQRIWLWRKVAAIAMAREESVRQQIENHLAAVQIPGTLDVTSRSYAFFPKTLSTRFSYAADVDSYMKKANTDADVFDFRKLDSRTICKLRYVTHGTSPATFVVCLHPTTLLKGLPLVVYRLWRTMRGSHGASPRCSSRSFQMPWTRI